MKRNLENKIRVWAFVPNFFLSNKKEKKTILEKIGDLFRLISRGGKTR